MPIDLRSSWAKHQRAVNHIYDLDREARSSIQANQPYSIITDLDPDTGWMSIKFRPEPLDINLSVVLGELLHDLRSALDHAISALVEISGASSVSKRHQFPIYSDEVRFDAACGTPEAPKRCLAGIKYGFAVIREVQPFHLGPNADEAALGLLRRLSNSDKHRSVIAFATPPNSYSLRLAHDGNVIGHWKPPSGPMWHPYEAVETERIQFARPYPTYLKPEADLNVTLAFIDRDFPPEYTQHIWFPIEDLTEMANQVCLVLGRLEESVVGS